MKPAILVEGRTMTGTNGKWTLRVARLRRRPDSLFNRIRRDSAGSTADRIQSSFSSEPTVLTLGAQRRRWAPPMLHCCFYCFAVGNLNVTPAKTCHLGDPKPLWHTEYCGSIYKFTMSLCVLVHTLPMPNPSGMSCTW